MWSLPEVDIPLCLPRAPTRDVSPELSCARKTTDQVGHRAFLHPQWPAARFCAGYLDAARAASGSHHYYMVAIGCLHITFFLWGLCKSGPTDPDLVEVKNHQWSCPLEATKVLCQKEFGWFHHSSTKWEYWKIFPLAAFHTGFIWVMCWDGLKVGWTSHFSCRRDALTPRSRWAIHGRFRLLAWGHSSVVECLYSICEALVPIPNRHWALRRQR